MLWNFLNFSSTKFTRTSLKRGQTYTSVRHVDICCWSTISGQEAVGRNVDAALLARLSAMIRSAHVRAHTGLVICEHPSNRKNHVNSQLTTIAVDRWMIAACCLRMIMLTQRFKYHRLSVSYVPMTSSPIDLGIGFDVNGVIFSSDATRFVL